MPSTSFTLGSAPEVSRITSWRCSILRTSCLPRTCGTSRTANCRAAASSRNASHRPGPIVVDLQTACLIPPYTLTRVYWPPVPMPGADRSRGYVGKREHGTTAVVYARVQSCTRAYVQVLTREQPCAERGPAGDACLCTNTLRLSGAHAPGGRNIKGERTVEDGTPSPPERRGWHADSCMYAHMHECTRHGHRFAGNRPGFLSAFPIVNAITNPCAPHPQCIPPAVRGQVQRTPRVRPQFPSPSVGQGGLPTICQTDFGGSVPAEKAVRDGCPAQVMRCEPGSAIRGRKRCDFQACHSLASGPLAGCSSRSAEVNGSRGRDGVDGGYLQNRPSFRRQ